MRCCRRATGVQRNHYHCCSDCRRNHPEGTAGGGAAAFRTTKTHPAPASCSVAAREGLPALLATAATSQGLGCKDLDGPADHRCPRDLLLTLLPVDRHDSSWHA